MDQPTYQAGEYVRVFAEDTAVKLTTDAAPHRKNDPPNDIRWIDSDGIEVLGSYEMIEGRP